MSGVPDGWNRIPKDDGWRKVHLARVEELGHRLWLMCDACHHTTYPEPRAFADEHRLEMTTPLLLIARRLRCSKCGSRSGDTGPPARYNHRGCAALH
jgi:hypothetical protein